MNAARTPAGEVALAARGLEVGYEPPGRSFALRVPALELRRGEVLAVLGPNGAGKSTLLRALAGLQALRAGSLERNAPRGVALVPQRPVLFAGSTRWNVEVAFWRAGIARPERRRRAEAALVRLGVAALAGRRASSLSGGEARRVALARALAPEPDVLLLDEPFDDLDAAAREALCVDLSRAVAETGVAVALVSHELRQALLLADRVAVLRAGALVQVGARDEVLRRPDTPEVAALVGMANGLHGRVAARGADGLAAIELDGAARLHAATPLPPGTPVWVGIRPEHVKLDRERGDPAVVGPGRVRELVSDGALVTAWIEWGGVRLRAHLLAGRGLGHGLALGEQVWIALSPEDVHVLPAP